MRISCSAPVFMMLLCISVGPCLATMRGGLFEKRTRKQSIIMPEGDPEEVVDSDGYRHQVGRLDLKQLDLDADEIEVQFPGDSGRTRYRRRSRRSRMSPDKPGRRTFFAESEDDSDATLTLLEAAAMDGSTTLTGTVLSNQTVYQIRQLPDQSIVIEATKSSDFPPEYDGPYPESEIQVDAPMNAPLDVVDGLEDFTGTRYLRANASNPERRLSDDGSTLDILVVYTRGAMCSAAGFGSGGNCYPTDQNKATMEALIELAVAETNAAYELSNIPTELRLVKAHYEATYNDYDNGWTTTLNNLRSKTGHFTYVHSMRSQYGADFVAMLVDSSSYCGIGYRPSNPDSDSAFSLTKWSCATGYFSFGHEVAHNMGCNHDRGNAGGSGSYNYGWQDPQGNFRSILAYDCPGSCPRVMRFSNPNVRYLGKVAGDAGANNAQWISERLSTYANFRQSVSNTPNATPQPTPVSQTTPTAAPNTPAPAQVSTSGSLLASMQGGYIGGEGNMFDIVARNDITITNFAVHAYAATTVTIEVYKRKTPGSCEGLHSNSDAWELIGTTSLVASNPASPTVLPVGFMQPVSVPRGTKQAFYVTFAADTNYNRYSPGTQFGRVYSSNGDLEFHEGYALAYKFGNLYYPRVFNGLVYYIDGVQQTTPAPTFAPTPVPTLRPTPQPTVSPTPEPTAPPTPSPTTPPPTMEPTPVPTPTTPTPAPSQRPTMRTLAPTPQPTLSPTPQPTTVPPTLKTTPAPTHAVEIITTMFAGGNGQAGNMFEIEAIQPLTIQSMEIHTYSTKSQRVLIFTKTGSYMGFERDSTQWRQVCDAEVIGQGSGNPTVVPEAVMQAVSVDGGKTQSFYVTLTESAIRYTNGVINTADSNIRFIHSSGKRYDFGDTFANRIFNGRLHYTVDGTVAPATGASSTGPKKNILTTYANRNGSYGNMFTVEAKEDVIIHNMYVHTFHRPGTFVQVEIYKMNDLDASYLTTHDQIDQWQLVGTANVEGQGTGNPTVLPPGTFSSGVAIPKGHSQSLYVTIVGGGLRYSNGASDSINNLLPHTWNDDLIVYEGIGIGVPRFGGMFPFRVFNGALEYSTPNVTLDERPTGDTLAITADTLLNLKGDEGDLCDRSSDCKSNFCGNVVDHGGNALSDGSLTRSRTRGAKHHNNRDLSTSSMVCLANNEIHQDDGAFATSQEEQEHARV